MNFDALWFGCERLKKKMQQRKRPTQYQKKMPTKGSNRPSFCVPNLSPPPSPEILPTLNCPNMDLFLPKNAKPQSGVALIFL